MIHSDSIYIYPQPNDIYDVLYSSKRKFSDWELRKFALERGIVVSEGMDREKLCLRIASLPFDYEMLQSLHDLLKVESRSVKTSSQRLEGKIETEEIKSALKELKKRNPRAHIELNVKRGKSTFKVKYNDVDHSVTRLKQRKPQKAEIVIEKSSDGNTNVRAPASSERVQAIVHSLFEILDENANSPKNRIGVDLSQLTPEQTNRFFLSLISGVGELPLECTLKVGVQKSPSEDDAQDTDMDEEEEELLTSSITAQINRATMDGYNPTESSEIQALLEDGKYYIHTIRWETSTVTVKDVYNSEVQGRVKLEVRGQPTKSMQQLTYEVINFRRYSAEHTRLLKTSEALSPLQSKMYVTMLEDAAYQCFEEVRNTQCATNGSMQPGD